MAIPTYSSSAVYNHEPNVVIVTASEALNASTDTTGWTVSTKTISSLVTNGVQIEITLTTDVIDTDSITVAYAGGGDITSVSTTQALATFTASAITNNVFPNVYDANPALLTGTYSANGIIDVVYNAGDTYTKIPDSVLNTPSILRTALQKAGLYLDNDRRGAWSVIKAARDAIRASL